MKTPPRLDRYFVTYDWEHCPEGLTLEEAKNQRKHVAHDFLGLSVIHGKEDLRAVVMGQRSDGEMLDEVDLFTAWILLTRHVEQVTQTSARKEFLTAVRTAIDAALSQQNVEENS